MARLTQADLVELNKNFEQRTPAELLSWCFETFGSRVAALTSMQRSGNVVCHMLKTQELPIKVLFVDTGVLFFETIATRDRLIAEYGLDIQTLHPSRTMAQQTAEFGVLYLTPEGQQQCCTMRKTDPLLDISADYDCLVGSLRRSDGGKRAQCPILAVDPPMNCLRVNPLVNFADEELQDYIVAHDVITNPLHEQGFATIGCNRCTTPVLPAEPKRAGRWRHLGPWSVYCGINPTDLDSEGTPAVEFSQDLVDRILGRETDFMI
ncbi:MAG: phosphoadenylyl-sulfate reductase [Planctomycetaceae bacterium]